jgi:DNA transposition AAA+ family ATPase
MTKPVGDATPAAFLLTKEYWRFVEFCDACRRYRYIGLCYGLSGVGKTLSARYYAHTDIVHTLTPQPITPESPFAAINPYSTVIYTPSVTVSPRKIQLEVTRLRTYRTALAPVLARSAAAFQGAADATDLLIVDEADRLKLAGLEQLRDIYDRKPMGLVLIGIPGIEKTLTRYPQLYSRVGFVHAFRPVDPEELRTILAQKWQQLGIDFHADDPATAATLAAMMRITGGNLRLVQRLCHQIERLLTLNALDRITMQVVEAARENLVIGAP